MQLPRFTNTLHFRISALFLVLLALSGLGYKLWIEASLLQPNYEKDEKEWFAEKAVGELDLLAEELGPFYSDTEALNAKIVEYASTVARFGVELILFDGSNGLNITSSNHDSLSVVVPELELTLVKNMSQPGWDYGSYPDPDNLDAYVNRIFEVDLVEPVSGEISGEPIYLVASYAPLTYSLEELDAEQRQLGGRALIILLIYGSLVALIIMAWTSRRISRLSSSMASFARGDLSLRIKDNSADEIGDLGRHFNQMAGSMEVMIEKLQEKEQFQRQLIANVSHDLRTPMASLRGYVETIQVRFDNLSETERQKYLTIIINNLDHLDGLVEHMLILSRFDSGQATFAMEDFPPVELADSVIMRCEGLAAERGIALDLVADDDVTMVKADPLQIAQVLQNLLENGIKFNQPGGSVSIQIRKINSLIEFSVSDTGMGISQTDLPHIFERFYTSNQSRTRSTESEGLGKVQDHLGQSSGLGLAISAKIIAGHDSLLKVDSEVGVGTKFTFILPAAEDLTEEGAEG